MLSSAELRDCTEHVPNKTEKKPKKRDKKPNKRRSKDDMDLKTANAQDEEIVVNIPKKKKDMATLITKQAIEIRCQKEIIHHGKLYCENQIMENERCVERIEERDQLITDKDNAIQNFSSKNQSLKSRIESIENELGEMEKVFLRKQNEVLSFEKQLKEANKTIETLHAEVENIKTRNNNGVRIAREESIRETSLSKENGRLKLQLTDRESLIADGRKVLQTLNSEKEQLQRQLRESERAAMEKQFTIDKLTREKERDTIQIRQKEMEASGKGQALASAESDLRKLREELRSKEVLLTTKERELERNESLLVQANEDKRTIEQRLEDCRRTTQEEISSLRQEKRTCEEQLRRLQANQQAQERTLQNMEAHRSREKQSADILRKDQPWMIAKDEIKLSDRVLGTGAWGRVLEGTFRGTKVAVKELHEIIQSAHNKDLFEREITFVTLVRHPCILQFLGVAGYRSNSPLLVTELMDMSLSDLLSRERLLTRSCVIRLGKDTAYGLNYLHCFRPRPIVHRDINPGNIMVWKHGDVWRGKLCDFGSADFLSNSMSMNPGNPFYSAPEVESPRQTDKVRFRDIRFYKLFKAGI